MITDYLKKLKEAYIEKYVLPQEAKLTMARSNIRKLYIVHPVIIFICASLLLVKKTTHYENFITYLQYYSVLIVFSLISILLCMIVKKHPKLKANVQMFPSHFSCTYMYFLLNLLIAKGNSLNNAFIIFACISIILHMIFDLEPLVYYILNCSTAIVFIYKLYCVSQLEELKICISVCVFTILTTTLSLLKWGNTKKDFLYKKTQHEYTEKMEKEIKLASLVQSSFFKHEETIYDDWTLVYYTKAMAGVSGDFIDFYNSNNKLEGIGIFDVSGHGIASGLVTMLVKNIITHEFNKGKIDKLKTVVDRINVRYLNEKGSIENYLTGILCRIKDNTVEFVNAGHAMPLLYKESEHSCVEIDDIKNAVSFGAIGLIGMPNNFLQHSVTLNSGDELILFTDGITDTTNDENEGFGRERLIRSVNRNAERPLTTQINCIISDVTNYGQGKPQQDDITMIILKKK